MATLTDATPRPEALGIRGRVRRSPDPARRRLGLGIALMAFGSFLPWLHTPVGNVLGGSGAGLWTFYAAMFGLGGVLLPVRLRKLAAVHATAMGLAGVGIVVWFLAGIVASVGFGGWMPGPGVVLVIGGGVLAASSAVVMFTQPAPLSKPAPLTPTSPSR